MRIRRTSLDTLGKAQGAVVVIDVLRAFTTAAFAFAAGAEEIVPVDTVEHALRLREQIPGSLAIGEVDGLPIADFDLGNSPSALLGCNLKGKRLIQRTSAGTQGIVRAAGAEHLLAASLCCAAATARYLKHRGLSKVTLVQTGLRPDGAGDEDAACADMIEARLINRAFDPVSIVDRVKRSKSGLKFSDPDRPEFPAADLQCAIEIDRFDFAMVVEPRGNLMIMRPEACAHL